MIQRFHHTNHSTELNRRIRQEHAQTQQTFQNEPPIAERTCSLFSCTWWRVLNLTQCAVAVHRKAKRRICPHKEQQGHHRDLSAALTPKSGCHSGAKTSTQVSVRAHARCRIAVPLKVLNMMPVVWSRWLIPVTRIRSLGRKPCSSVFFAPLLIATILKVVRGNHRSMTAN